MSEPRHHVPRVPPSLVKTQVRSEPYASEVLLIADTARGPGAGTGRLQPCGTRAAKQEIVEGLSVESVVRRLAALLDEGLQ